VNPTARDTTQATSPAPYPIIVPSSISVACAAKGAMAVANAATAAAFWLLAALASTLGTTATGLNVVLGDGVENADAHATTAAKMNAMVWKVFMLEIGCENRDYDLSTMLIAQDCITFLFSIGGSISIDLQFLHMRHRWEDVWRSLPTQREIDPICHIFLSKAQQSMQD